MIAKTPFERFVHAADSHLVGSDLIAVLCGDRHRAIGERNDGRAVELDDFRITGRQRNVVGDLADEMRAIGQRIIRKERGE